MRDETLLCKLPARLGFDAIVRPVGLVIDEALLVVEERVEQHQPMDALGVPGREQRADPAPKARADEADQSGFGAGGEVIHGGPDVVHDTAERQVLLAAPALSMGSEVEPQRRHAPIGPPEGKTREEAAFLPGGAPTV